MTTRLRRRAAVLLAAVGLAGCTLARKTPETRYYVLVVPPTTAPAPVPLRVGAFTADDPYAGVRLAYRPSPYRLGYYTYHRWAGDAPSIVADAVRDHWSTGTLADARDPMVITGHVRRLEEVDGPEGWSGALTLEIAVRNDRTTLLARTYTETEPAPERTTEAVVAALSRALGRILDRVARDLADRPAAVHAPTG